MDEMQHRGYGLKKIITHSHTLIIDQKDIRLMC